jgi:hypothetical protein
MVAGGPVVGIVGQVGELVEDNLRAEPGQRLGEGADSRMAIGSERDGQ